MRTHIRAIALLTAVVGVTSCSKDFLTEVPVDFVAPENFYRNKDDAVAAVNAAYATFVDLPDPLGNADYMGRNLYMLVEYPTEMVTSRLSAGNERSLIGTYHPQFASNHAYLQGVWKAAYFGNIRKLGQRCGIEYTAL